MAEHDLPILHAHQNDHAVRAFVVAGTNARGENVPLTTAGIKRHRYVQNLKNNHQKLIEALSFLERFAVVCELSEERIHVVQKVKEDVLAELSLRFEEKLKMYDARMKDTP